MIPIEREILEKLKQSLNKGKVVILLGPRRVGKTYLLNQIKKENPFTLMLNGEDLSTVELLERRTVQNYQNLIGKNKLLIIDEAQKIQEIGIKLKLMIDNIPDVKILVTGSSAFDLDNEVGEPLTGRKITIQLFTISEREITQIEDIVERSDNLKERLIYGNYPELIHLKGRVDKANYLKDLVNSYLLKDILSFDSIRNSDKLLKLLRLIAFQIGNEVSLQELGRQLSMSKNTVERYLDLLTKVFIVHKVSGFSRNLRKEVTKNSKWYFSDNGIRNLLIANFNAVELRDDMGKLWENYIISERLKQQSYNDTIVNNYFWRTYDQQEIDWVEDRGGRLYAYEFKWNSRKKAKIPVAWKKEYTNSLFQVVSPNNYFEWLTDNSGN